MPFESVVFVFFFFSVIFFLSFFLSWGGGAEMGVVGSFLLTVGVWRYLVGENKWRANAKPVPESPRNRTWRYYHHHHHHHNINGDKAQDIASIQTAEKAEKSSRSPLGQAPD